jgi:hypothetical protein
MHKMQLNKRKTSFYVNDPADYRPAPEKKPHSPSSGKTGNSNERVPAPGERL